MIAVDRDEEEGESVQQNKELQQTENRCAWSKLTLNRHQVWVSKATVLGVQNWYVIVLPSQLTCLLAFPNELLIVFVHFFVYLGSHFLKLWTLVNTGIEKKMCTCQ